MNKHWGTFILRCFGVLAIYSCLILIISSQSERTKQSNTIVTNSVQNTTTDNNAVDTEGNVSNAVLSVVLNQPHHRLAPGDVIRVNIYTPEYTTYEVWLDTAGQIKLPLLNYVKVEGLTCSELAAKLEKMLLKYFRQVTVDVRLVAFGYFWVLFIGTDYKGDMAVVQNGTSLMQLLNKYNVNMNGRYRRITLIRGAWDGEISQKINVNTETFNERKSIDNLPLNKNQLPIAKLINQRGWLAQLVKRQDVQVEIIDPTEQTVEGNLLRTNISLKRGDIVYVPAPEQVVKVEGTTKEGLFELLPGENLGQILKLAGSFGIEHDLRNTVVKRFDEKGKLVQIVMNLQPALEDTSIIENFEIRNRDIISFIKPNTKIYVLGQVNEPGAFDYNTTSNVTDYLALAKGYTREADLSVVTVVRGARGLNTTDAPPTIATVLNLRRLSTGDNRSPDFRLQPGDVIFVPDIGFQWKPEVIIQGIGAIISGYAASRR